MSKTTELVARGVEPELVERLEQRAAAHGVSSEEEHLRILRAALLSDQPSQSPQILKDLLFQMPDVGSDSDFARVRDTPREVDLL